MNDAKSWIIRRLFTMQTGELLGPNDVKYSNGAIVFYTKPTIKIAPPVDYTDHMDYAKQVIDILFDAHPELTL